MEATMNKSITQKFIGVIVAVMLALGMSMAANMATTGTAHAYMTSDEVMKTCKAFKTFPSDYSKDRFAGKGYGKGLYTYKGYYIYLQDKGYWYKAKGFRTYNGYVLCFKNGYGKLMNYNNVGGDKHSGYQCKFNSGTIYQTLPTGKLRKAGTSYAPFSADVLSSNCKTSGFWFGKKFFRVDTRGRLCTSTSHPQGVCEHLKNGTWNTWYFNPNGSVKYVDRESANGKHSYTAYYNHKRFDDASYSKVMAKARNAGFKIEDQK